jgi:methylmalonyl-CoA/ethylmalonyl-CoA epimerase
MGNLMDPQIQELLDLPPVSQVGMVVRDLSKAVDFYTRVLKIGPFKIFEPLYTDQTYRGRPGNFLMRLAFAPIGPIDLEIIQPLRGATIYDDFLKAHGEGLHHLGFDTDRLAERIAALQKIGIGVLQSGKRPGASWAYFDTESLAGYPIELIERSSRGVG